MKGKLKLNILFYSVCTIMLCSVLVLVSTYALFLGKTTVKVHLETGSLSLKLERVDGVKTYIDDDGVLQENIIDYCDFTNPNSENIFGISSDEKIIPTSYYIVNMKISNLGTIAFDYSISLDTNTEYLFDEQLADEITIYFGIDKDHLENKGHISDLITNEDTIVISNSLINSNSNSTFTVKIEFDTLGITQNKTVEFDLLVKASQHVNN